MSSGSRKVRVGSRGRRDLRMKRVGQSLRRYRSCGVEGIERLVLGIQTAAATGKLRPVAAGNQRRLLSSPTGQRHRVCQCA